jgi:hypothetical protein
MMGERVSGVGAAVLAGKPEHEKAKHRQRSGDEAAADTLLIPRWICWSARAASTCI